MATWEWLARVVARALARDPAPDQRSLAVISLLRRLASGEEVDQGEKLKIAEEARRAPSFVFDMTCPANIAAMAAWAASRTDPYTTSVWVKRTTMGADATERENQISDAIELLGAS